MVPSRGGAGRDEDQHKALMIGTTRWSLHLDIARPPTRFNPQPVPEFPAMATITEPEDVLRALAANSAAQARYEALPPSHKAEYLTWIDEAKRPATRERRIAGMIERLTT
jgi:hypothetical protein